ncbi:hypothetical protein [Brachyspira sp.]|uniref:hypothetical protein n=1 Tax=Brachyspira sp. TaxID=1977261 RepID=UPI002627EAD9|nr:hypothetical protein [Brachyspira sp.]
MKSHENDKGIEEISVLIKDKNFDRALYNSALLGYSDIVSGLVKSGADINNRGVDGSTPLILENIDAAKILIDNGADISISDDNDKKAFNYIVNKKDIIGLVSVMSKKEKRDYFTLEDYAHFEKRKYTFKYYIFKAEDDIFYLNQISLLDNNNKTSTIYKYNSKDNSRMTIDDISYSFTNALIGANYYNE